MLYGFVQSNSRNRGLTDQIEALESFGVERKNIFVNKEGYQNLLSLLKERDTLVIKSMDKLSLNYKELTNKWKDLTKERKVDVKVVDTPFIDTTRYKDILGDFVSDLVLQVISFQEKQEQVDIQKRQAAGIAAAKGRGVKFGRPRKPLPSNFEDIYSRYLQNEPIYRLAKECKGISESTLRLRIYERLREDQKESK